MVITGKVIFEMFVLVVYLLGDFLKTKYGEKIITTSLLGVSKTTLYSDFTKKEVNKWFFFHISFSSERPISALGDFFYSKKTHFSKYMLVP